MTNKIPNRVKPSVSSIINIPGVILSSSDMAKLLAMNFACNSTLDKDHRLADFLTLTEGRYCDLSASAREGSGLVKSLDSTKAIGQGKIILVYLKNLNSEIYLIFCKLFNSYLKEKCFISLWKVSTVYSVFKNVDGHSFTSQYRHLNLLSVTSNLFESMINLLITPTETTF